MKKCQFCAEEIQDAAIVCNHCGREGLMAEESTEAGNRRARASSGRCSEETTEFPYAKQDIASKAVPGDRSASLDLDMIRRVAEDVLRKQKKSGIERAKTWVTFGNRSAVRTNG